MPRFVYMEENDDNTTTITSNLSGEERTMIFPVALNDIGEFMKINESTIEDDITSGKIVAIPNSIGEYVELKGDDIPYHLRADSEALAICDKCGRETWDADNINTIDKMTQPNGQPCGGRFNEKL